MRDITESVLARKLTPKIRNSYLKNKKKFITTLAVALGIIGFAVPALVSAFDSGGSPSGTGDNTIAWTGQGATNGVLNTSLCDATNDPFGANHPYLLWVLTTDGGSATITGNQGLSLGGTGSGTGPVAPDTTTGNTFKFVTPYFTPDSNLTASATFSVVTTGNGAWVLTISHGCVGKASPTISTTPNPTTAVIGDTLNDSAVLSGGNSPTGDVTFKLYSPSDLTCSGTPAYTETDSTAPYATITGFASSVVGTWHWTAHYAGDSNNNPADSLCADEAVTVTKAQLGINTTVHSDSPDQALTSDLSLGQGAHDSAAVTGGVSGFNLPSVTFWFFDKGVACTDGSTTGGTQLNTMAPDSNGIAHPSTSETALAAGTYNFMAVVAGNDNYLGATSNCEPFTVDKAQLTVTTAAHDANHNDITNGNVPLGSVTHDTATVTGGVNGFDLPAVSFTLTSGYTDTCANGASVGLDGVDAGNNGFKSADSTALGAGSYAYRAVVANNDNYVGNTSSCEPFTVNKAQLSVTTAIHNANHQTVTTVSQGTVVHDTAAVSGVVNGFSAPAVAFTFFTNATCFGTGTSAANLGADEGTPTSVRSANSAALAAGLYSYKASIAGNTNYLGNNSDCEPLTVQGFWCSPGFWATALSQKRTAVLSYLFNHTDPQLDLKKTYYITVLHAGGAPLKKGNPDTVTLAQVLGSPSTYGGPAFNSVADYIARQLGWNGTQLTGENCPLNAQGVFTLTLTILTL
jgi:hypothetical protein